MTSYTGNLNLYQWSKYDTIETTITEMAATMDKVDKRLTQTMISVLDFGAKGDGLSDDTAAFNTAIDSLPNGGIVIVPYGKTYRIQGWKSDSVNDYPTGGVKLKSNITLIMHGATLSVIPNDKDHYTCINITNCQNVKIAGGTLYGERLEHTNSPTYSDFLDQWGYGVAVIGSSDVYIENVTATNFMGDGFYVGARADGVISANVNIKHCLAHNNRRQGLSITGCYGGAIAFNTFRYTNGCAPESGIDIEPNPGKTVSDMHITHNKLLNNAGHGILFGSLGAEFRSGKQNHIDGNVCRYNGLTGIYLNQADHNEIVNNVCSENEQNGIAISESAYNTIQGNKAHRNQANGIMIGYSESNSIINNHATENGLMEDKTYDNFQFFGSHYNNIQGNTARTDRTVYAQYGMSISADCNNNIATNNDLAQSGFYYGFINLSTTTLKGAGNRGNAYASWGTGDYL